MPDRDGCRRCNLAYLNAIELCSLSGGDSADKDVLEHVELE